MPIYLLILASITVLAVAIGLCLYLAEKRRTAWMQQSAEELHLSFFPRGDEESLTLFREMPLFSRGRRRRILNLMQGMTSDLEVRIFDYHHDTPGQKGSDAPRQTVIAFRCTELDLPRFALGPRTAFERMKALVGYREVAIANHSTFSKAYVLRANEQAGAREIFSDAVLSFLEEHPGLNVDGQGFQLVLYRPRTLVPPEKIRSFLEEGLEFLNMLRQMPAPGRTGDR